MKIGRIYWVAAVALLFGISVIVRLPYLNRPLSTHHEWLTAQTLVIHSIWHQRGIASCGFNPITSFDSAADKHIITPIGKMMSPQTGDCYYISQPPLGYILPYIALASLGFAGAALPLQVFNLVVHFLCVLLVFVIVKRLALKRQSRFPELPALAGAAVYIFMPATLWFHGNVYSFEILVQLFFLLAIYIVLVLLESRQPSGFLYGLLGIVSFCMSYTEWLGIFFAFTVVLLAFINFRDQKIRIMAMAIAAGAFAAVCLTLFQYSQIAGLEAFLKRAQDVYIKRSGISHAVSQDRRLFSIAAWNHILQHYIRGYGYLTLLLGGAVLIIAAHAKKVKMLLSPLEWSIIALSLIPVILHHFIFFNFTAIHDYSVLKDAVFLSILTGIIFYTAQAIMTASRQFIFGSVLGACFLFSLVYGIFLFFDSNRNFNSNCMQTGRLIARTAQPDEVVFAAVQFELCPQVMFYAQRNIAEYWNEQDARGLIRKNGARRGIVFELDEDYRCTGYHYLD